VKSTIVAIVEVEHAEGDHLPAVALAVAQRVRFLVSEEFTTHDAAAVAVPGMTAAEYLVGMRGLADRVKA
jgi:hypothetical protein